MSKSPRRHRAHHDRRLGRRFAGFAARLRQSPCLQGRDRPLAPPAHGRVPRARQRGDDPTYPSRATHRLEPRRLAARPRPLAHARSLHTAPSPRAAEDWDLDRIVADYAAAAQRMAEAGLDGFEVEAYGHLPDQFWSPGHQSSRPMPMAAISTTGCVFLSGCSAPCGRPSASASSSGCAWSPTRTGTAGLTRDEEAGGSRPPLQGERPR